MKTKNYVRMWLNKDTSKALKELAIKKNKRYTEIEPCDLGFFANQRISHIIPPNPSGKKKFKYKL